MMRFDWELEKSQSNRRKHRVSFEEACTVFADPNVLTIHDDDHSAKEDRWVSIGTSDRLRVLVVIHTWPEPESAWRRVGADHLGATREQS